MTAPSTPPGVTVATVLRDMAWQKCLLNVRSQRGSEIVTSILHVDPANKTFIFDWCRADGERGRTAAREFCRPGAPPPCPGCGHPPPPCRFCGHPSRN